MLKSTSLGLLALFVCATPAIPQQTPVPITPALFKAFANGNPPVTTNNCTGQAGLACAIPNLYGPYGLILPSTFHTAHFNSTFQSNFSVLNDAIATQLTLLPLASPASGFSYEYDPVTGAIQQVKQSFGPVLTERAETIGRHKFFFGATFQRFRFGTLDGLPLHNLPAVFFHQRGTGQRPPGTLDPPYESQFVSTQNSLDLKVNQYTVFGTFGLTDRVDVSVAIPLLQIGFNVLSNATINRTVNTEPVIIQGVIQPYGDRGPPYAHYFDPKNVATSLTHTFSNDQSSPDIFINPQKTGNLYWDPSKNSAAGVGDVVFRFKGRVYRSEHVRVALLTDLRAPTGNELNFLGSGAWGVKPFAAISVQTGPLTPHVNLGYQWNGSSILAGNILNGTKDTLPGFAFFSAGTDIGVTRSLTLAVDYIGQELINAPRVENSTYTVTGFSLATGQTTFADIRTFEQTYNQSNAAFGFKYNLFNRFQLSGNLLVALNDGGLRQRVAPLVGLSYTF